MRVNLFPRSGSPAVPRRLPLRRTFRPHLEMLESRLVLMGPGGPPSITSLSPAMAVEGGKAFTLTVNGSNFISGAVVDWNGMALSTTFVSGSQLTALVPASLLTEETGPEHGGPIAVTVVENGTSSNPAPFTIAEAPIVAKGGFTFTGPVLLNVTLATFTDTGGPETTFDYSATVDWGDGVTDVGLITGPDASGVFTVTGSHAYANTNPFVITVTIIHETAPPVMVKDFVNTGPATIMGVGTVTGVEGQLLNNIKVASFTNPTNPSEPASDFSATIDWGDGSTTTGTITGPDAGGTYTVTGSHTYKEEGTPDHGGPYTITVTVLHMGAAPASVTDSTNITDAPLSATGGFTFTSATLSNATLANFTDTGGPEPLVDYSATINWGDNSPTSTGTITGPSGSGVFTVTGSHTYSGTGTFTITVTIKHETAPPVSVTDTVNLAPPVVMVTVTGGFTIFSVEGPSQTPTLINNATVATFTSSSASSKASDFTATISWGDAAFQGVNDVTTGTITGPDATGTFTVKGSYTYIEESEDAPGSHFVITVTVKPTSGPAGSAQSQAIVFDAAINATGGFNITGTAGQPTGPVTLATFVDTHGIFEKGTGTYVATIDWGDGSPPDTESFTGNETLVGGQLPVTGNHTYGAPGTYTITVTINHEFATPVAVTDTATIATPMLAPPGSGGAQDPSQGATTPAEIQILPIDWLQGGAGQDRSGGTILSDPAAQGSPLLAAPSAKSLNSDTIWQALYQGQGNQILGPNDWAVYQLALAVSDGSKDTNGWSAPI